MDRRVKESVAKALLEEFQKQSEFHRIEQGFNHGYRYKPAYRCLAILIAPSGFRETYLDNKAPSYNEAIDVLKHTHPFFIEYIDKYPEEFSRLYHDMVEVWRGE